MSWLREFRRIVMGILRELSDESAYARHLRAEGRQHSREEWRRFSECRMQAKYQRPRCC